MKLPILRPESDEMLGLDALRFVAAMGIVIGHSAGRMDVVLWFDPRTLRLFVDLFFLISGFVIAHVYLGKIGDGESYARFLVKRAARLLPLHWLTLAAAIVVGVVAMRTGANIASPELYNPACILPNALLLHSLGTCGGLSFNAPSWSISAEAVMYVIAPLIFLATRSRLFGWGLFGALFIGLSMLPGNPWHAWTSDGGALRALPSFLLGVLLYRVRDRLKVFATGGWAAGLALLAFFGGTVARIPELILLLLLYATVIAVTCDDLAARTPRALRRLAPLGQLTYSIYMIHELWLIATVSFLSERVLHLQGGALNAAIVASVISVVGISYFSLVLFEKPSRRAITKLYDRMRSRGSSNGIVAD